MPSLASELKSVGYETLAMHPYRGYNYRRHLRSILRLDLIHIIHGMILRIREYIRSYISDQSLAERIRGGIRKEPWRQEASVQL